MTNDSQIVAPLAGIAVVVLLASGRFSQFKNWLQSFINGSTTSTSPLITSPLNDVGGLQGQGTSTLGSTGLTPGLPAGWTGGFNPPAPAPPDVTGLLNAPQTQALQPTTNINSFLNGGSNQISILGGP